MHPGNRSVGLDRASKGEGRKRWRETMQVGFVSASESGGSHGGCRAEEGQAVTSSVAPCFLAACGEWTGGKWGSRENRLRGWGNDPGSGFRPLTSAQREALPGSLPAPNPTPKPRQRLLRKPSQLPPGKPRLAERDVQKPAIFHYHLTVWNNHHFYYTNSVGQEFWRCTMRLACL